MNIGHRPYLPIKKVEARYSDKDGMPVKYVCTSALSHEAYAMDIFYRETPHPEFGNRYFGLFKNLDGVIAITNADAIEDAEFTMVEVDGTLHYSKHRHDYYDVGRVAIDGGRSYFKMGGHDLANVVTKQLKVRDGEFVERELT